MASNKNIRYIIPICICSIIVIALVFNDEWLSFQQCRYYEQYGIDNYRRELRFINKYPNSKYYSAVCKLFQGHEVKYVQLHFNNLVQSESSGIDNHSMIGYQSSYEEYKTLFPNGTYRESVESFLEYAQRENDYYNLKYSNTSNVDDFERFIRQYPNSPHRAEIESKYAAAVYSDYSLENGAQPYAKFYGRNQTNGGCKITIKSSYDRDYLVIVKYNDSNGKVAGHVYVQKGNSASIGLRSGNRYQVFFYSGKGWYPEKQMPNDVKGGFLKDERFTRDASPFTLSYGETMTYTLTSVPSGNFSPSSTDQNSVF